MNNAIFDANVDATLVRNLWSRPITVGSEREPIDLNIVCRSVWKLLNDSRNASSRILETKVRLLIATSVDKTALMTLMDVIYKSQQREEDIELQTMERLPLEFINLLRIAIENGLTESEWTDNDHLINASGWVDDDRVTLLNAFVNVYLIKLGLRACY